MNRQRSRSRWAEILGHDTETSGHVGPKYPLELSFRLHGLWGLRNHVIGWARVAWRIVRQYLPHARSERSRLTPHLVVDLMLAGAQEPFLYPATLTGTIPWSGQVDTERMVTLQCTLWSSASSFRSNIPLPSHASCMATKTIAFKTVGPVGNRQFSHFCCIT